MEKFIEVMVECKGGIYRPCCINVSNIVGVEALTFYDSHPLLLVKQGKKVLSFKVEEDYLLLKARLGVLEIQ